jgi:DUF1680 family protein
MNARIGDDGALYRTRPAKRRAGPSGPITTIPYFLWANRAAGPMRVWIPLAAREA